MIGRSFGGVFASMGTPDDSVPMVDAILFNTAALVLSFTWTLRLRLRSLSLAPAVLVLLHVLTVQTWVMTTGLVGGLDVVTWRWVSAGAIALTVFLWRLRPESLRAEWCRYRTRARRTLRQLGPVRATALGFLLVALTLWLGATGWLVGPHIPDVINYYLVPPTDWVADGALTTRNWRDPRAFWPQGHGLLGAWWMAPTASVRASAWAELHWLMLTAAALWALVRGLGGNARQAAGGVALLAGVPVVWAQCTSGLNDLAVSALALTALVVACTGPITRQRVGLALAVLLVGVGVKPTMLFLGAGVGAVGLLRGVFRGLTQMRGEAASQARPLAAGGGVALCAVLVCATLTGSYWYARNAVHTGNPFYPQAVFLGGEKILGGHDYIDQSGGRFSFANMKDNLFDLVYEKMWDSHRIRSGQTEQGSGFGPTAAALGMPALLALGLFVRRARPLVGALALMTALLAAGVHRDIWNGRFFSFLAIAGVGAVPLVYARLGPPVARALWGLMIASATLFGAWYAASITAPPLARSYWQAEGLGPVPLAGVLPFHPTTYLASVVDRVPPGETIALVYPRGIKGPAALLHDPDLGRRLVYLHDQLPDAEQLKAWRADDVNWLLVMESQPIAMTYDRTLIDLGLEPVGPSLYRLPLKIPGGPR